MKSAMNPRMQEFLKLTEKNLQSLINEQNTLRFNFQLDMNSQIYDALNQTLSKSDLVSKLIKGKPLEQREAYFITQAMSFCLALEQNREEKANSLKKEIEYFRHCFLEDSEYWKIPIEYQTLCKFLE
ncbi:MAG: hypothetical protein Q8L27_04060 [archaeon]|nr:hypothetical protein [archaeon]